MMRPDEARAAVLPLVQAACDVLGVTVERALSADMSTAPVQARSAVAHVLYRDRGWTLADIGKALGRDHSTISVGIRRTAFRLRSDQWLAAAVDAARRTPFATAPKPGATGRGRKRLIWSPPAPMLGGAR